MLFRNCSNGECGWNVGGGGKCRSALQRQIA